MPATSQYDVLLDGHGFMIDPESYRGRLKAQLAPKTRTGDAGFGDLAGSSAWAQRDFTGGFGYEEWDPQHPTRFADGTAIDISYGDLRPGRTLPLVASSPNLIAPLVIHGGVLYGIESGGTKIWRSTAGTTWTVEADLAALPAVQSLWVLGLELHAGALATGDIVNINGASSAVIAPGAAPGAAGISAGFQWTYDAAAPGIAELFATTGGVTSAFYLASGGAAAAFVPYPRIHALATDGREVYLGAGPAAGAASIAGAVYYATPSAAAPPLGLGNFRLLHRIHDNAISCFQVYRGQLYAGSYTKGIVWKVTDAGLEPFFQVPELAMSGTPPSYTQPIRQMTTDNDRLYVPITDREGACIYQFDGTGWCRFTPAVATTAQAIIAFGGAIILATAAGIYRAAPGYASPATLITSWFDAALGGVDKIPLSFTLTHTPLIAGQSVTVEYALDDATSWATLGTSNTVGASEMELTFPGDVEACRIRFRYTLTGSTSAAPIKLRNVVFAYQLAPDMKREWLFTALCAGVPGKELVRIDETAEPLTGAQISDMLWTSRAKKEVLDYTDIDAAAYRVTFESLEEEIDRGRPRAELATRAAVRLVET